MRVLYGDGPPAPKADAPEVGASDAVLEIGSAFGDCTRILALRAAAAVGVDLSEDFVTESRRLHPQCCFEWLDFFDEPERLDALWAEVSSKARAQLVLARVRTPARHPSFPSLDPPKGLLGGLSLEMGERKGGRSKVGRSTAVARS